MGKTLMTYLVIFAIIVVAFQIVTQIQILNDEVEYSLSINDRSTDYECEQACEKLKSLKCEEGNDIPMPDGGIVTCAKFCKDTVRSGVGLNATCVMTMTSCSQLESQCMVGNERAVDPNVRFR